MNKKVFTLLAASLVMGSSAYAQCPSPSEANVPATKVASGDYYYLAAKFASDTDTAYFAVTKNATGTADSVIVIPKSDLVTAGTTALWQVKTANNLYTFQNRSTNNLFSLPINEGTAEKPQIVQASTFGWNYDVAGARLGNSTNLQNYQVAIASDSTVYMDVTTSDGVSVFALTPGWIKLTADKLNTMSLEGFRLFDHSTTSATTQSKGSTSAIQQYFKAVNVNGTPADLTATEYALQSQDSTLKGKPVYLNVDTTYYSRISLPYDTATQNAGHVLGLDTLGAVGKANMEGAFTFTVWQNPITDSIAVEVYGVPYIETPGSGETFGGNGIAVLPEGEQAWITIVGFDDSNISLSAGIGCLDNSTDVLPNAWLSFYPGTGVEIPAGYYYMMNKAGDSIYVATLNYHSENESFSWIATPQNMGQALVPAAQWYVPTTSVTPAFYNRESVMESVSDLRFYEVTDENGNVIVDTYAVSSDIDDVDTVQILKVADEVTKDAYLGYKRFALSQDSLAVASVYPIFNSVLNNNDLYIVSADSMLSVAAVDKESTFAYHLIAADTLSIGCDTLRAISYYMIKVSGKDTTWMAMDGSYQIKNTAEKNDIRPVLIRSTYTEGIYQILPAKIRDYEVLSSADRIALVESNNQYPQLCRAVEGQISVAATNANVYWNEDLSALNGLWSFENELEPEYATVATGHAKIQSSQNVQLAISMSNANIGVLKGTEDLKSGTYTDENFSLWLQCVDTDTIKPLYTISTQQADVLTDDLKANNVMYYMNVIQNPTTLPYTQVNGDSVAFSPAVILEDTLYAYDLKKETIIKTSKVAAAKALAYTYAFRETGVEDSYYVESQIAPDTYLAQVNGVLTTQPMINALAFSVAKASAPTANEGVTVATVKVVAGEGVVTIAGAAGKKVTLSNILGQTVATQVLSSDNATIAAPRGVVVVAVEGEEAIKAIVK